MKAQPEEVLPVRIGLKQQNLHNAEQYLMDVSDPRSPNYGRHWSADKVAETFAPLKETTEKVTKWLLETGIGEHRISHSQGRNWLQFDASVSEAESLFNTEYYIYEHKRDGGYRIACDEYHLPRDIQDHVDFAMPTIQLDGLKPIAQAHPSKSAS